MGFYRCSSEKALSERLSDLTFGTSIASGTQSFPATIGKKYLVGQYRGASSGGIASGATEDKQLVYLHKTSSTSLYLGIVTATATTVTFSGTNNTVFWAELD